MIKKCHNDECQFHTTVMLPLNVYNNVHYLPAPILKDDEKCYGFDELYGTDPDEKDRPSRSQVSGKKPSQQSNFQLQASKAGINAKCHEYIFPRLLYSCKLLSEEEKVVILDCNLFTCGTEVPGVYQPKSFYCFDPISPHYYQLGKKVKGYVPLCMFCLSNKVKEIPRRKSLICDEQP